jgi:hypothetical protein
MGALVEGLGPRLRFGRRRCYVGKPRCHDRRQIVRSHRRWFDLSLDISMLQRLEHLLLWRGWLIKIWLDCLF